MAEPSRWIRPVMLFDGATYYWRRSASIAGPAEILPVQLLCYDACPAFVIVATADHRRLRCPRDELFAANRGIPEMETGGFLIDKAGKPVYTQNKLIKLSD